MLTQTQQPLPAQSVPAHEYVPRRIILTVIAAAGFLTFLADFLFWGHVPGVSLAIYFFGVVATILALHRRSRPGWNVWAAAGLLLATLCATAMGISFTNVCVLVALTAVIAAESWYRELPCGWARWSEPFVALLLAPGRWFWFVRQVSITNWKKSGERTDTLREIERGFEIIIPVGMLITVFVCVLFHGNAIFGEWISRVWEELPLWIPEIDISVPHCVFVFFFATVALVIARPRCGPVARRLWARRLKPVIRGDQPVALWQSRLTLLALNALFFIVNTIDVFYLWRNAKLPANVSLSQYVHQGVFSLNVAVLLSGMVIVAIFQQQESITRTRFVKTLALGWIAQNLVLIAGVFLRLKLYVDALQLSTERVYVGCFLLLVATGFLLLAWHVAREGDINALIFRCVVAVFALFFVLQFVNVAGWVAHYNVARWERDQKRALDVGYLENLGPDAWPALFEVASFKNRPGVDARVINDARNLLYNTGPGEERYVETWNWRSWQAGREGEYRWLHEQRILTKNFSVF
ncbi:MAG: DUF4173 domain-containing protein [Chthoniobacteraceae bacterium]